MKTKMRYFTVGPSAIYPQVDQWTQDFYDLGYASISHRSEVFQKMYQNLDKALRELMQIPISHSIFIASSGSEIMERILQNCVQQSSFHFVNGAFSKKFYDYALRLGLDSNAYQIDYGCGFEYIPNISDNVELIAMTHNETSTGIKTTEDYIHSVKRAYPNKILALDIVSSAPFVRLDFNLVDMCFFSSQKCFGLPAGLGIWIIDKKIIENLTGKVNQRTTHNTLSDYSYHYRNYQTPSTPNVLGVYLLSLVADNMNKTGWENLYAELLKKKEFIQNLLANNDWLKLKNLDGTSSDTVIPAEFLKNREEVMTYLAKNGLVVSSGYKEQKDRELRFANYPAIGWEDLSYLEKILM